MARFKIFGVMKEWHSPNTVKHAVMSRSVAVIVQLSFSLGDKLYDVDYHVNYDQRQQQIKKYFILKYHI